MSLFIFLIIYIRKQYAHRHGPIVVGYRGWYYFCAESSYRRIEERQLCDPEEGEHCTRKETRRSTKNKRRLRILRAFYGVYRGGARCVIVLLLLVFCVFVLWQSRALVGGEGGQEGLRPVRTF